MSLKTWKEEFYPVPATSCKKEDALIHSLNKWRGLLYGSLVKHNVGIKLLHSTTVVEYIDTTSNYLGDEILRINGNSCALCHWYLNFLDKTLQNIDHPCQQCPLFIYRKGFACDEMKSGEISPWDVWKQTLNPSRMISLIENAILAEPRPKK